MGEIKTWNQISRLYERKRYESIMYVCILKSQDWPCGISAFFFISVELLFQWKALVSLIAAVLLVALPWCWCPVHSCDIHMGHDEYAFQQGESKANCSVFYFITVGALPLSQYNEKAERVDADISCLVSFLVYLHLWISLLAYIVLCLKISSLVPSSIARVDL